MKTIKKRKCITCGRVLDNRRVCKDCGKIHGAFYKKYPDICKVCFNKK